MGSYEEYEEVEPLKRADIQTGSYILHFEKPPFFNGALRYGDGQHYIGASKDILKRVAAHKAGVGSKMTQAAYEQKIDMILVAIFPFANPTYMESLLTAVDASTYCPLCNDAERIYKEKRRARSNWATMPQQLKDNILRNRLEKERLRFK